MKRAAFAMLLTAGVLAACSGGGTGPKSSLPTAVPTATATATSVPTASPTPSPTPIPTPSNSVTSGTLTVTPASFSFSAAGQAGAITMTDPGFSGSFTVVSNDTNVATVAKVTNTQYSVQAGTTGGTTTVNVSDGTYNVNIQVQLAITSGVIQ